MSDEIFHFRARQKNSRRSGAANRRFQHVLDVSVRASHAGKQRQKRLFKWLSTLLIVLGVGVGLYFGASRAAAWLVLKNPDYNVAQLVVETDGVLDSDEVLRAADLQKGANIFLVNLGRTQQRVESIAQVEHAEVTRQLPNRIVIQITERKPVAWIAPARSAATRDEIVVSPQSWLVDANGIALRPRKLTPQDKFLPIVRNYPGGTLSEGQVADGDEIKAALDLIRTLQQSLIATRFQIEDIDLAKRYGLDVTDRNGSHVLFALDELDRQLKRLDMYLQYSDQRGEKLLTINLLAQKNVPATFLVDAVALNSPAAAPSPSPGPFPAGAKSGAPSDATNKGHRTDNQKSARDDGKHAKSAAGAVVTPSPSPVAKPAGAHSPQPFIRPQGIQKVTPEGVPGT